MLKGIQLTLLAGPAVPRPVPLDVIEALTSAQVTVSTGAASGFQLEFKLSNRSPLHTLFLVSAGSGVPLLRVILVVTLNGLPTVLIDGVATNHQTSPGSDGRSTLTVTGEDLTRLMDYKQFSGLPFPALPSFLRVHAILAKYASLGVTPKVIPSLSSLVPNPLDIIPRQQGTDLAYIRYLASTVGYVFYLDPGPQPGRSTAYWGPSIRIGQPQPALTTNMDAHTNVESLDFTFNGERKTSPVMWVQEPFTKMSLPIPLGDVSPLSPPLGQVVPPPKSFTSMPGTAKYSFVEAAERSLAAASNTSDVVTATGSLDVMRYGRLLEPRKLVAVRGAGYAFDGVYYVERVTHRIRPSEYKQDFALSRNGLVSITQRVPA